MKTNPLVTVGLISLLALAACSHWKPSPSTATIAGKYQLVKVDGKPVPAQVDHGPTPIQVVSGQMDFDSKNSCTSLTVFSPIGGENIERRVTATYARNGKEIDLKWHGAGRTKGTFEGNAFTMNNEGMIFSYQRVAELE